MYLFIDDSTESLVARVSPVRRRVSGVRTHAQAARWRLARVRSQGYAGPDRRFFGVDVGDTIEQLKRHYALSWHSADVDIVRLNGEAPRLELKFD